MNGSAKRKEGAPLSVASPRANAVDLAGLAKLFPGHDGADLRFLARSFFWTFTRRSCQTKILKGDITFGRLGNNYKAARNAVCVALYFGFEKLLLRKRSNGFVLESGYMSERDYSGETEVLARVEREDFFFYCNCRRFYRKRPSLAGEVVRRLQEACKTRLQAEALPVETLVIHLRSGDIFTDVTPHPLYVQPPLCWYAACMEHHAKTYGLSSVIVVCEDRINPCVNAILSYCEETGIPAGFQSGTLDEDFSLLMAASSLVSSRSTLMEPVKDMSPNLRHSYEFLFSYVKPGMYMQPGEWKNSGEQRRLMLNLPSDALILPEDFDAALVPRPFLERPE